MRNDVIFALNRLTPQKQRAIDDGFHIGRVPSASTSDPSNVSAYISTKWTCECCTLDFYSNPAEKFEHLQQCRAEHQSITDVSANEEEKSSSASANVDPLAKEYYCDECGHKLWLTPINILKHRRSHK
jgi:hypothetical protein